MLQNKAIFMGLDMDNLANILVRMVCLFYLFISLILQILIEQRSRFSADLYI